MQFQITIPDPYVAALADALGVNNNQGQIQRAIHNLVVSRLSVAESRKAAASARKAKRDELKDL